MIDVLSTIPYNASTYFSPYHISPDQVRISAPVLLFTAGVSLLTGLLFGLAPAVRATREEINSTLKGGSFSAYRSLNLRDLLVVGEIALALVLLIGAGLMIKSFLRLQDVATGFNPANVLTAEISLPRAKYRTREAPAEFYRRLLERVQAVPSVESAGLISSLPLSGMDNDTGFLFEDRPVPDPRERPHTHNRIVSTDYFRALGVPVLRGRAFTAADNANTSRVAMINDTMARLYWPGEDPIGKHIALDFEAMKFFEDKPPEFDLAAGLREIVGVVGDVKHLGLENEPTPEMYVPLAQSSWRDMSLVVRAGVDPATLAAVLRREVLAVDPEQALGAIKPMPQLLADSVARRRFNLIVFAFFATVALVLTAAGVYGVTAYSVSQQTREIGIRMALGARARDVVMAVITHGARLVGAGICIGLLASFALTRLMASLLFDVSATDPAVFGGIGVLLGALGLLACYLPARRATRVDPVVALRYE
jgi:putative ABC transport system permease protein